MIVLYENLSEEQILESAKETIPKIEEWFKNNPKRRACVVELWYGKIITINKASITETVNKAAQKAIASKKEKIK